MSGPPTLPTAVSTPRGGRGPGAGRARTGRRLSCPGLAAASSRPERPRRVLCYGDSLTAGFYAGGQLFEPYGRALSEALAEAGAQCNVTWCGLSGHLATQMVEELDEPAVKDILGLPGKGLARILDEDGPHDLVLIMAGTNDLGRGTSLEVLSGAVAQLHAVCHSRGVPTVALAPPLSTAALQEWTATRRQLAGLMAGWPRGDPRACVAFADAEELVPKWDQALWESDGIHFSAAGSRALGRRLANTVLTLLQDQCPKQPAAGVLAGAPVSRTVLSSCCADRELRSRSGSLASISTTASCEDSATSAGGLAISSRAQAMPLKAGTALELRAIPPAAATRKDMPPLRLPHASPPECVSVRCGPAINAAPLVVGPGEQGASARWGLSPERPMGLVPRSAREAVTKFGAATSPTHPGTRRRSSVPSARSRWP